MSKPLVVSIPHRLGKKEALRRLKANLGSDVGANFGHLFSVQGGTWTGDHLAFQLSALGEVINGTMKVAEDRVDVEVVLPWLLAAFAEALQPVIYREGTLMLEKK